MSNSNVNSNVNSISNVINLEKKQTNYGLIQDFMTLGYCLVMIPLSVSNIISNINNFTWHINVFSYLYFIITGLINVYYREYNFVIHHIICLDLIFMSHSNINQKYITWLSYCFMAEVSNIFLSGKNILKHFEKKFSLQIKKNIYTLNDLMFFTSYFGIRIFFLIPLTCKFMLENYFDLEYSNFIIVNVTVMCLLNLYWGYFIIKKAQKIINKSKIKSE